MLDAPVLVLTRSYIPIHITTVKRAFCLLAKGHVCVLGPDFRPYTMEEWMAEGFVDDERYVETPRGRIAAPRVLRLVHFDKLPRREVKFSRKNVYLRDQHTCSYCGHHGRFDELNLDHVVPVSRGGKSCWENVVTACIDCNSRKEDRRPEEVGLCLRRRPQRPTWQSFMGLSMDRIDPAWLAFMPHLAAKVR